MKISVLGCGRWGSFIAWYLARQGNDVASWGPEEDYSYRILKETGKNEYVTLDKKIQLTCDLEFAVTRAEIIVISISAQGLRGFMKRITAYPVQDKMFVLCMKGIETGTGKRLSQILTESGISPDRIAVWVGPGHIQSFVRGEPNCMVIDSENVSLKRELVHAFRSDLIRFYYGDDLIGTEIGAAAKNVMGIAAGALDVLCVPLKGPLMSRGAREVARLIRAMGGNELSAYGLAHLGDYETTLFSEFSHNRRYGEMLAKGQRFDKLAEGVATSKAMRLLGQEYGVELPITEAVYNVCYGEGDDCVRCREEIGKLFQRSTKAELY
ncbi:MAG: glycerol-3-phosphate dehydrogenase [Clostridia bacterium]|jgi:glycerol-3-phosphate dehydrogenase (NAD(P)+)|nr:glycerol-3-phosphate dehydrogenase [Clostridia bacterium]